MTVRKDAVLQIFGVALAALLLAACRTASPVPTLQPTSPTAAIAAPTPAPTPIAASAPPPTTAATSTPTPTPTAPQATVPPSPPSPSPTRPPVTVTSAPAVKSDPMAGEKAFYAAGCIGCHTVLGVGGRVGPDLTDIAKRRDAAYIRESEKDPKAFVVSGYPPVMPSAAELGLQDQDIENIIAWFQSLR